MARDLGRSHQEAQGRRLRRVEERTRQPSAVQASCDWEGTLDRSPYKEGCGPAWQPDSQRGWDSMTTYYPIVIESETSGAVSAYVPGLPVFAAADTRAKAEQAIRKTLVAYLEAIPNTVPTCVV